MTGRPTPITIFAACYVGISGMPLVAAAGGFSDPLQSASSAATAGAGATALGEDAATVWYNPAGMALISRPEVLIAGGLSFPSVSFHNGGSTDAVGLPTHGNSSTNATDFLLPSLFATLPLSSELRAGIGVFVPFGQSSKYDDDWVGRYQIQQVFLDAIDIRPAFSYRVNDVLTVGGALDVQHAEFKGATALDFGTLCLVSGACAAEPESADGRLTTKLDTWGVGYDFGILIEPSPNIRLGINYKSSIRGAFSGDARFDIPPVAVPLTATGEFTAAGATTTLNFPQIVSLGVVWRLNKRWTGLLDASWTQWSEAQQFILNFANLTPAIAQPLHWNDGWRVAVGGIYHLTDDTDLRAGVAFDQSPIDTQFRTALLPQADDVTIGVGIRHRITDHLQLTLSYDYDREMDASLSSSEPGAGTVTGVIHQQAHSVGLQALWQF